MKDNLERLWDNIKGPYKASLLFLLFAVCALAFQNAWVPGMFLDGGIYATLGKNAALKNHWLVPYFSPHEFKEFFQHPPFVFMLEGLWMKIVGTTWLGARTYGFLYILGMIFFLWCALKKEKDEKLAYSSILILFLCVPFLKKLRFPNLDMPLTMFTILGSLFYWRAYKNDEWKNWVLAGLSFGAATLCKGHPALFIPFSIFVHLIVVKEWKRIFSLKTISAFLIGMAVFAIWPTSLYFAGSIKGFNDWIQNQFFNTVVDGRGKQSSPFYTYLQILATQCAPWFLLSLYEQYQIIKNKEKGLGIFLSVWFWATLIPLSMIGWKLSHYILPVYPPMAILAAMGIRRFSDKIQNSVHNILKGLIVIFACVLLITPVSTKVRRDKELHYAVEVTNKLKEKPTAWADVNEVYGFWSFAAALTFATDADIYRIKPNELEAYLQGSPIYKEDYKWAFYVGKEYFRDLKRRFPKEMAEKVHSLISFEFKNTVLLVDKRLLHHEGTLNWVK